MCRRFIPVDRDEVARIAAEIERDLADHADELESLDPLESFEAYLSAPAGDAARASRAQGARCDAATQLSLFDNRPTAPPASAPPAARRGAPLVSGTAHRGHRGRMRPRGRAYGLGIRGSMEERARIQHAHRDGAEG